ncbi:Conserved hypothetical membrane protein [Candidatus Protochlamydia naegleriophila]|uniref:Conserved hypothetical membrane protein n=1 Tax=Candidatus Protochlamydia naegleriophila TaxID=389348 RepID=A0A0U5ERX0_9BACT|nr:hypothetical protein [Candidatus Protochlamydia naegleriophila]CUI16928.1 Conserved hypothetical membrane protein [Candidatus Protochlamydia naegleriophila]
MRFIGITICALITVLSMSFSFFKSKPRDYADIAREIRGNVGKKLSKKHRMNLIGVGGGMMGSVYMIGLSFQVRHPLEREEARYLVVDCTEELLAAVNGNEAIRPYLRDFPFTTKNVRIVIFSVQPNGKDVCDPAICVASVSESDEICYRTQEPNSPTYKNRCYEPYAEARAQILGESL